MERTKNANPEPGEVNMNREPATGPSKVEVKAPTYSRANARLPASARRVSRIGRYKAIIIIFVVIDLLSAFAISGFLLVLYMQAVQAKKPVPSLYYIGVISSLMVSWVPSGILILFKTLERRKVLLACLVLHAFATLATCVFLGFIQGDLHVLAVLIPLLVLRIMIWIWISIVLFDKNLNKEVVQIREVPQPKLEIPYAAQKTPYEPSHPKIEEL